MKKRSAKRYQAKYVDASSLFMTQSKSVSILDKALAAVEPENKVVAIVPFTASGNTVGYVLVLDKDNKSD